MLTLLKFMAFMSEFELAITPKTARHYARLRVDADYWRSEVDRMKISSMFSVK